MISRRVCEVALWGIAAIGSAAAMIRAQKAIPRPRAPTPIIWGGPDWGTRIASESLEDYARTVVAADPFRLDRTPARVPYAPAVTMVTALPPPVAARPSLTLAGLVGGPRWAGIVEGIPGMTPSAIVHAGDVLGTLRIRKVDQHGVVISGIDTTWILTLKRPWH